MSTQFNIYVNTLIRDCIGTPGDLYNNTNCTFHCSYIVTNTSIPCLFPEKIKTGPCLFSKKIKVLLGDIACDTGNISPPLLLSMFVKPKYSMVWFNWGHCCEGHNRVSQKPTIDLLGV